jgi:hypothetical protein
MYGHYAWPTTKALLQMLKCPSVDGEVTNIW